METFSDWFLRNSTLTSSLDRLLALPTYKGSGHLLSMLFLHPDVHSTGRPVGRSASIKLTAIDSHRHISAPDRKCFAVIAASLTLVGINMELNETVRTSSRH